MSELEEDSSRRKFIRVATVGASAACGLFPLAAGIPALLDPVQKSRDDAESLCLGQKWLYWRHCPRMVRLQSLK